MAMWPIAKIPQLPRDIVDPGITVSVDEVEHPSDESPARQTAGEDQPAHGTQANRRASPMLQPEVLNRCGAAANAGDDGADQSHRPFPR